MSIDFEPTPSSLPAIEIPEPLAPPDIAHVLGDLAILKNDVTPKDLYGGKWLDFSLIKKDQD